MYLGQLGSYRTCEHCGTMHGLICPFIKSIEYYENGSIKKIEYLTTPPQRHVWESTKPRITD